MIVASFLLAVIFSLKTPKKRKKTNAKPRSAANPSNSAATMLPRTRAAMDLMTPFARSVRTRAFDALDNHVFLVDFLGRRLCFLGLLDMADIVIRGRRNTRSALHQLAPNNVVAL